MVAEGFFSVDSLAGVHVLVVDSDEQCQQLLSAILRYCGALVTTTGSAEEALGVMRVVKCDVLVVELKLGGQSGIDLISGVRALEPERGGLVRAIAVSATPEGLDAAMVAGFDAKLVKPIQPWRLCRMVATLALPESDAGQ